MTVAFIPAPYSIPEPRWAIASSSTPAWCWARMASAMCWMRPPATYTQFPQQGTLLIEDDVEIGANSTIDRGALQQTKIGRGTKIDNLVHVGHNCEIGEDVILVALVGISGSCTVGNGAIIAGQVGIGDHAHVGPGVILGGQAGVLSGKTVTNDGLQAGNCPSGAHPPARSSRCCASWRSWRGWRRREAGLKSREKNSPAVNNRGFGLPRAGIRLQQGDSPIHAGMSSCRTQADSASRRGWSKTASGSASRIRRCR